MRVGAPWRVRFSAEYVVCSAAWGAALPLVALLATSPTSFAGGGTRSWWRRNDNVRADAQTARDEAQQAFYELDTAQREVRISVEAIRAVEESKDAKKALADFDTLGERINQLSTTYIDTLDAHDLDNSDLEASEAQRAQHELVKIRDELKKARTDLERFSEALAPLISEAEDQLAQVVPAVERAKQAWLEATNAVESVKSSGLHPNDLMRRLVALNDGLTKLNEGAAAHGVRPMLQIASTVRRDAEAIRTEAERLPERVKEIDKRVRSLRTRTQAARTRLESVQPTLSELRRRFHSKCWQDLQEVQKTAEQALRDAEQHLTEAAAARDEQRWPDATTALGTVRSLLNDADAAAAAPSERLRALNEVEQDPRQQIEQARFVVRDAQRLAMDGRARPDPRDAEPLDRAVETLERVDRYLTGRHPDYWGFLTELESVKENAASVVQRIRDERAHGRG